MVQHKCELCEYKSNKKSNLIRHLNAHSKKQNVIEDDTNTHLIPILYSSHTYEPVDETSIQTCPSIIQSSQNNNNSNLDTQSKKCNFCGNIYTNSSSLSRHYKTCNNKKELETIYIQKIKNLEEKLNHLKETYDKDTNHYKELLQQFFIKWDT